MAKVEIVAEIGVNHGGSLERAVHLADLAIEAGADVVKTQLSVPEAETSAFHARLHMEMIRGLMLSREDVAKLAEHVMGHGKEFMCTPAEEQSFDWLVDNHVVSRMKLASDALNHPRFLAHVAKREMPVILSTGMGDADEVSDAFMALRRHLALEDITVLHCTSLYPTAPHEANLLAIRALKILGCAVGWSDHTLSLTLPVAAAAMGAVMIEKHLTHDCGAEGPDHAASLEPHQFAHMVANVRELEQALGDGIKRPQPRELEVMKAVRKSIVAAVPIKKGTRIDYRNVAVKRPGTGMPPNRLKILQGRIAERDYAEGEMIDG